MPQQTKSALIIPLRYFFLLLKIHNVFVYHRYGALKAASLQGSNFSGREIEEIPEDSLGFVTGFGYIGFFTI